MENTNLRENTPINGRLVELLQYHSIKIEGVFYIDYYAFTGSLHISGHINNLIRRKNKYPLHFIELHGRPMVSEQYASALINFQLALQELESIKSNQ